MDQRGNGLSQSLLTSSSARAEDTTKIQGAEQGSLLDEGYTAAPEADNTVSTKLAERGQAKQQLGRLAQNTRELQCKYTRDSQEVCVVE